MKIITQKEIIDIIESSLIQKEEKRQWSYIEDFDELYAISNFGDIYAFAKPIQSGNKTYIKQGRILKGNNTNGYIQTELTNKKGVTKSKFNHVLVGLHFIDNPYNKMFINHKDSIRHNNYYKNLEWVTSSENAHHGFNKGNRNSQGDKSNARKLDSQQVKEIRIKYVPYKYTLKMLAAEYNVDYTTIHAIISKKHWNYENCNI